MGTTTDRPSVLVLPPSLCCCCCRCCYCCCYARHLAAVTHTSHFWSLAPVSIQCVLHSPTQPAGGLLTHHDGGTSGRAAIEVDPC
jgi:hypothetical protein